MRYRAAFFIAVLDNPRGALKRRTEVEDFVLESCRPTAELPHILNHFQASSLKKDCEFCCSSSLLDSDTYVSVSSAIFQRGTVQPT